MKLKNILFALLIISSGFANGESKSGINIDFSKFEERELFPYEKDTLKLIEKSKQLHNDAKNKLSEEEYYDIARYLVLHSYDRLYKNQAMVNLVYKEIAKKHLSENQYNAFLDDVFEYDKKFYSFISKYENSDKKLLYPYYTLLSCGSGKCVDPSHDKEFKTYNSILQHYYKAIYDYETGLEEEY